MADLTGMLMAASGSGGGQPDPNFNQTVLLLHGDGTNGAQNNTFLDSSTNNFTITRNGNTTQGTFSPFSSEAGKWSNYFDGTANGSLRANSSTDTDLSGDFTLQAWVYPTANGQASNSEIMSRGAASTLNGWHFGLVASSTQPFFGINYAGTGATVWTASSTNIPLNQWTHLAVTRSGNTVVIYINGVADTTNTGFTGTPTVSGTEYVYVGRASYDTTNRQFTGYISNASIIKGTALTTFNTTTSLATGTSGQSLLTCTANRFVDANTATTAKALTVGSGASVQPFSPFAPTAAYDASVNGGSGYFDGTGDYLTVGSTTSVPTTGDFTLSFWMYNTSSATAKTVVSLNGNTGSYAAVRIDNSGTGGLILNMSTTGSSWQIITSTPPIGTSTLNRWSFISCVRDGGTIRFYQDGVQVYSSTTISAGTSLMTGTAGYSYIGAVYFGGVIQNYIGYVTDIRVEATALYPGGTTFTPPTAPADPTGSRLCLNFTNAGIFDNTGKNNLETVGNAQIDTSTKKFGTGSMEFDGTGDYLLLPRNPDLYFGSGNFTVECWVYPTASPNQPIIAGHWSGSTGGTTLSWVLILSNNSSRNLRFLLSTTGSTVLVDQVSSTPLALNAFNHVAFVRNGDVFTLYLDGVAATGGSYTISAGAALYNATNQISIGGSSAGGQPFQGLIDDLRITKGVARYTTTFTPPTAPFPDQ